jgi:hypothetical protein
VHTLSHNVFDRRHHLATNRQPALARVCRASRRLALGVKCRKLRPSLLDFYNPTTDIVRIEGKGSFLIQYFRKYPIASLGIPFAKDIRLAVLLDDYLSAFARHFRDLRELVVLLGHRVAQRKVIPISIAKDTITLQSSDLQKFVKSLRNYLDRASQAHGEFQIKQKRKGITVPDWPVPDVKVVYMQEISGTGEPVFLQTSLPRESWIWRIKGNNFGLRIECTHVRIWEQVGGNSSHRKQ